ncbi:MAG TPA: hypothetical protein VFK43_11145 [Acidimicrobiales bacterium]|nr:hypothetical protein [Acidimicrobiales bacterium]
MSNDGVRSAGRVRKSLIAVGALATVLVPGSPAEAATTVGRFTTLPAGDALGLEVDGVAVLRRTADGTSGRVVLRGLEPGLVYAAHLHNQPCGFNAGGSHYKDVTADIGAPPNELWFSSTGDPFAGVTANRGGVARGFGAAEWVARPEAQSVVIHQVVAATGTSGGPKIACADLE